MSNISSAIYNDNSVNNYEKLELESSETLKLYTVFIVASCVLELVKQFLILKFSIQASRNIHGKMIKSIVSTGMHFFDNCFIGNILNRFSQDLTVIDEILPFTLEGFIEVR